MYCRFLIKAHHEWLHSNIIAIIYSMQAEVQSPPQSVDDYEEKLVGIFSISLPCTHSHCYMFM